MEDILIKTIPHDKHRKEVGDTVGDWYNKDGTHIVEVSKMSDRKYEALVIIHELVEGILCTHAGISPELVDKFDKDWKEHDGLEEQGDDPKAPYHRQHCMALVIE